MEESLKILDRFTQTYQKHRKQIELIIFFSTFIGGMIQFVELIFINPAYLRFFSGTQMLGDSLVMTFFFMALFAISQVVKKLWPLRNSIAGASFFAYSLFVIGILVYDPKKGLRQFYQEMIEPGDVIGLILVIAMIVFFILFLISVISNIPEAKKIIASSYSKSLQSENHRIPNLHAFLWYVIWTLIIFSVMKGAYLLTNNLHHTLIIPSNLKNLEVLCKHQNQDRCLVRYFNDKYVFVEEGEGIRIIPFTSIVK